MPRVRSGLSPTQARPGVLLPGVSGTRHDATTAGRTCQNGKAGTAARGGAMGLRWTEDQLTAYLRRGQPAPISEAAFQSAVVKIARANNWLWYHTHDSRRSPSGFVDGVLAKAGSPLYLVELKTDVGQVTPAQAAWLEALGGCTGVVSAIWRPKDLEEICRTLRG